MALRGSYVWWWSRTACRPASVRAVSALLLCCLLVGAVHAQDEWEYEVKSGETLWAIATRYLKGVQYVLPLQKLNRIERPSSLPPGTRLRMPYDWTRSSAAKARVIAVHGEVRVEPVSGGPKPATVGAELDAGDRLMTAGDSNALLEFADGSRMRLNADGSVKLKSMRTLSSGAGNAELELERGRTESTVTPAPGRGTRFLIETPSGISSVRGTEFRVASEQGAARTEVTGGRVAVDAAGRGVQVDAGFGTRVQAGAPPMPPVALLPPPDLSSVPARIDRLPVRIDVAGVHGASAYRVQLLTADAALLLDVVSDAPAVALPEISNGRYALRVRAIDAIGLEGRQAERALEVAARPAPPAPSEPEPEALIERLPIAVRWAAPDPRLTYRVQVAEDSAFSRVLVDVPALREPRLQLDDALRPGTYWWRIASVHPHQGEGAFGEARSFRLALPAPRLAPTALSPQTVRLAWSQVDGARGYEVQVAQDPAFSELLALNALAQTSLELPRPAPGRYFVRVRPVDEQGNVGPLAGVGEVAVPSPPMPPALLQPTGDANLVGDRPEMKWRDAGALRYRVQLAANASFDRIVLERTDVVGDAFRVDTALPPGRYFWRVASVSIDDGQGDFAAARSFRILNQPPAQLGSAAKGGELLLSWSTAPAAARYRVQLAKDEQFSDLLVDQRVDGLELRALRPQAGRYFMRVSALDGDGVAGPYSGTHSVKVGPRYPYWLLPLVPLLLVF